MSDTPETRARASDTSATRTVPTVGFIISTTALLWLMVFIASAALWPIYQSPRLIVLVAVSVLAGSVIAILGTHFRWSSLAVLGATLVVYLTVGVAVAVPGKAISGVIPTAEGELDLLTGTATAWKQLLTVSLPVGDYEALLVPAFVLVLVSTVIALSIGLRARWGELGVVPPIVIFITATLFGPDTMLGPDTLVNTVLISLGLLAATLTWLIWSRWYRRRQSIRRGSALMADGRGGALAEATVPHRSFAGFRTISSAALIMAIAGTGSVAATYFFAPSSPRQVLRSAIVQPFEPRDYASPLSSFRAWEQSHSADASMLRVDGLPAGGRVRIATLDTYNGIVFTVGSSEVASESGSFTRVPATFDQSQSRGTPVSISVRVDAYRGVWLPTIGKLESIRFESSDAESLRESFFYNDNSGAAAVVRNLAAGDSYRLTAVQPTQPTMAELSSLRPGSAVVPAITNVPDRLTSTLDNWVRLASDPGSKLVAMITALQTQGFLSHGVLPTDPPSRSGHSADRITRLLSDPRMIGDQEQYAVTAAVMARQLGFPSRVVVGFAPTSTTPTRTTTIHGSDISAWIEVDTSQFGWVTIDPTPPARIIPAEVPTDPTTATRPQSPVQPPAALPRNHNDQVQADSVQPPLAADDPALQLLIAALHVSAATILGLAVLLAPFALIIATKARRRRRRRRAPTNLLKISGGWQEFEDAVRDHGFEPPVSPTRAEVASLVGGAQSRLLAATADKAVFSPGQPANSEADLVWISVTELRHSLGKNRTRRGRIRALLSLRSFGGRSAHRTTHRTTLWRRSARRGAPFEGARIGE